MINCIRFSVFLFLFVPIYGGFDSGEVRSTVYDLDISADPLINPAELLVHDHAQDVGDAKDQNVGVGVVIGNMVGQKYYCTLPVPVDTSIPIEPQKNITIQKVRDALAPLIDRKCLRKTQSWWTYEVCYGKQIRQFHLEGSNPEPMGKILYLGHYHADFDWEKHYHQMKYDPKNGKVLFHTQTYSNGTLCDLNDQLRTVDVKFFCDDTTGTGSYIDTVDEPSSCTYVISVHTGLVCGLPGFDPPNRKPDPAMISCQPMLSQTRYEAYQKETEEKKRKEEERRALAKQQEEARRLQREVSLEKDAKAREEDGNGDWFDMFDNSGHSEGSTAERILGNFLNKQVNDFFLDKDEDDWGDDILNDIGDDDLEDWSEDFLENFRLLFKKVGLKRQEILKSSAGANLNNDNFKSPGPPGESISPPSSDIESPSSGIPDSESPTMPDGLDELRTEFGDFIPAPGQPIDLDRIEKLNERNRIATNKLEHLNVKNKADLKSLRLSYRDLRDQLNEIKLVAKERAALEELTVQLGGGPIEPEVAEANRLEAEQIRILETRLTELHDQMEEMEAGAVETEKNLASNLDMNKRTETVIQQLKALKSGAQLTKPADDSQGLGSAQSAKEGLGDDADRLRNLPSNSNLPQNDRNMLGAGSDRRSRLTREDLIQFKADMRKEFENLYSDVLNTLEEKDSADQKSQSDSTPRKTAKELYNENVKKMLSAFDNLNVEGEANIDETDEAGRQPIDARKVRTIDDSLPEDWDDDDDDDDEDLSDDTHDVDAQLRLLREENEIGEDDDGEIEFTALIKTLKSLLNKIDTADSGKSGNLFKAAAAKKSNIAGEIDKSQKNKYSYSTKIDASKLRGSATDTKEPNAVAGKITANDNVRVKVSQLKVTDLSQTPSAKPSGQTQKLEQSLVNKLKQAGFDPKGRNVQVKVITSGYFDDDKDDFHVLSDEQSDSFANIIVSVLGGDNEQVREVRRHKSQSDNYALSFDDQNSPIKTSSNSEADAYGDRKAQHDSSSSSDTFVEETDKGR